MTLTLERVSFVRRGRAVLSDISAVIPAGTLTCVAGPNAAGKTTLLRLLCGELKPASGRYLMAGVDAGRLSQGEIGREIAIIPQDVQPPPHLTVAELAALARFWPGRLAWRGPGEEDLAAVRSSLARCRADGISSRPVESLSGGEQRRAWLAFGLARGRRFLLLDETLDGLDIRAKRAFFRLLQEIAGQGTGVALTTHDLRLVEDYAGAVAVLSGGKMVYQGPPVAGLEGLLDAATP